MRIVIQQEYQCPFLSSLSKSLSVVGNEVILWSLQNKSVYEMAQQIKPDLLILVSDFPLANKYRDVISNIPYIAYGCNDIARRALLSLPRFDKKQKGFIDEINYTDEFEDSVLGSDILVSTNFINQTEQTLQFADHIFQNSNLTIKALGNTFIPSPYFVGLTTEKEFMSIAKASKFVLATNQIEKVSLLNHKIYSHTLDEINDEVIKSISEEKLRRKKLKESRQQMADYKTSNQVTATLLNLIDMPDEALKLESLKDII